MNKSIVKSKSKTLIKSKSKTLTKTKTKTKSKSKSKSLIVVKSDKKPILLEHQLKTVRYLVSRCRNQHGLLLFHSLGSGKTNLALFLKKNFPLSNLVLILPYGLDKQWINAARILDVKIDLILTYNSLSPELLAKHANTIKNSILVVDEAHHLIDMIKNISEGSNIEDSDEDSDEEETFDKVKGKYKKKKKAKMTKESKNALLSVLDIFKSAKKVLLLTGTPIKNDLGDIRWLINIAAGKEVVPYNIMEFTKNYYKSNKANVFKRWLDDLMFNTKIPLIDRDLIPARFKISFSNIEHYQAEVFNLVFGLHIFNKFKNILERKFNNPNVLNTVTNKFDLGKRIADKLNVPGGIFDNDNITLAGMFNIKNFVQTFANNFKNEKKITQLGYLKIKAVNILKEPIFSKSDLIHIFILAILAKGLHALFVVIKQSYDPYDYTSLEMNKLVKASPYLSYYSYDNLDYYPETIYKQESVSYTDYQLYLWIRIIYDFNITNQESVSLGLNKNITEAELFKPTEIAVSAYIDKCRIIGNLFGYNPTTTNLDIPIKFKRIVEIFKNNPINTIVYSNFENSLANLSRYLTANNITNAIFEPSLSFEKQLQLKNDFRIGKLKMLLLHPNYYEGFDIKNCRMFHILEPLLEYYKREQLYGRPVRYLSHADLPKKDRNVTIIQWRCSISNVFDQIRKQKTALKDWFSGGMERLVRYSYLDTNYTPDDQINNFHTKIDNQIKEFRKTIKQLSIDNSEIPMYCNVYGDPQPDKKLKKC